MATGDTAALIVSLEAKIDKFTKSMDDASAKAKKTTQDIESNFAKATAEVSSQLNRIANTAADRIPGIGGVLLSLGPAGIAAAVGIGLTVVALEKAKHAADEFAQESKQLVNLSGTLGLSITQLEALSIAATRVGVSQEQLNNGLLQFATRLDAAQKGEGDLFKQVQAINAPLAEQLSITKSVPQAFDLIAKASANLTNETDKLNLARAAFGGRRNLEDVRVLELTAEKGGIEGVVKAFEKEIAVNEDLRKKVVEVQKEIDALQKHTKDTLASLFGLDAKGLEKQVDEIIDHFVSYLVEKVKAAKDYVTGGGFGKAVLNYLRGVGEAATESSTGSGTPPPVATSRQNFNPDLDPEEELGRRRTETAVATEKAATSEKKLGDSREDGLKAALRALNAERERISILGDAATPADRLKLKQLELNAAVAQNATLSGAASKAMQQARLDQDAAASSIRQRLGVETQEGIQTRLLLDIEKQRRDGVLSASQAIAAGYATQKEALEQYVAEQEKLSKLPGLTRFGLDAQNNFKLFDQFATQAFSHVEDDIADVVVGTKKLSDAIRDMVQSILRDLVRLAIRQAITGPIANAISGVFSPATGPAKATGGPVSPNVAYPVGEQGPEIFVPNSAGYIIPNNVIANVPTGPTTNINWQIDARGADMAAIRRLERALIATNKSIESRSVVAVNNHYQRYR